MEFGKTKVLGKGIGKWVKVAVAILVAFIIIVIVMIALRWGLLGFYKKKASVNIPPTNYIGGWNPFDIGGDIALLIDEISKA